MVSAYLECLNFAMILWVRKRYQACKIRVPDRVKCSRRHRVKWDHDTVVDFGVSRTISVYDAPANTACFANCTGISNLIYNPYAGLDIESEFDVWLAGLAFRTSW